MGPSFPHLCLIRNHEKMWQIYIYWNIHWHLQTKLANHHVWTVFSTGSGWSCTSVRFTGPNVESEVLFLQLNIRDIGKGKTHEWNLGKKKKKNNLMFPKVNCWKKEKGAISIPRVIIPRVLSYCIASERHFFLFRKSAFAEDNCNQKTV